MPVSRRHFARRRLQFITSSTYRRTKLFDSHRFRYDFVEVLRQFRRETGFLLVGWVLMPEHFHLADQARTGREHQPPHARAEETNRARDRLGLD
jgi:REP element-mobilizing transposase RayT